MSQKQTFATALNCIDGRVQRPVSDWIKSNLNVDFVDTITEPGIDRVLSGGDRAFIEEVKRFVGISVSAHGSHAIVLAGHHGCAADPVLKEKHFEQIRKGLEVIKSWDFDATVVGLFVNKNWEIEVVA